MNTQKGVTLAEAGERIGDLVIYNPGHGSKEEGVIVDVNSRFVMVRYERDSHAKATAPEMLEFLSGGRRG